jgi:osmotically-inducible protein OsmY
MSRFYSAFLLVCVLTLPFALGGCAGLLVVGGVGAAAGGGYAAAQERGVNGAANDFAVKTEIERGFLQTNPLIQQGVTTTVYNRRVLLTGRVDRPEMKADAKRVASTVAGVRTLYDEIEVAPAEGGWDDASPDHS